MCAMPSTLKSVLPCDQINLEDPTSRFLGLGLVGIDELLAAPSQRQQIALQTRPMEEHDVTGVLTVEFLFIDGADVPELQSPGARPLKIKESLRTLTPQGLTTTTKTIFKQNASEFYDDLPQHHSWSSVLYDFVMDPEIGPYARIKRKHRGLDS